MVVDGHGWALHYHFERLAAPEKAVAICCARFVGFIVFELHIIIGVVSRVDRRESVILSRVFRVEVGTALLAPLGETGDR